MIEKDQRRIEEDNFNSCEAIVYDSSHEKCPDTMCYWSSQCLPSSVSCTTVSQHGWGEGRKGTVHHGTAERQMCGPIQWLWPPSLGLSLVSDGQKASGAPSSSSFRPSCLLPMLLMLWQLPFLGLMFLSCVEICMRVEIERWELCVWNHRLYKGFQYLQASIFF